MWRTMASVDDQVALTLDWLSAHGELSNTLVVLTSDNGFHHGQKPARQEVHPVHPCDTGSDLATRPRRRRCRDEHDAHGFRS
jgi:arylsulfatase A-like enzyme